MESMSSGTIFLLHALATNHIKMCCDGPIWQMFQEPRRAFGRLVLDQTEMVAERVPRLNDTGLSSLQNCPMDGSLRLPQTSRVIDDHSGFHQRGEQICRIVWERNPIPLRIAPRFRVRTGEMEPAVNKVDGKIVGTWQEEKPRSNEPRDGGNGNSPNLRTY